MVAGIRRVDGNEWNMPQVLAALEVGFFGSFGLGECSLGERVGNAVGMDRDQAGHLLRGGIAEPFDDARGLHAIAAACKLEADQLAALGISGVPPDHGPFFELLAVDRVDDARAAGKRTKYSEHPLDRAREPLDGPRL